MNKTSSTRSSLAMEMGELYTSECSSPLYLEFNWTHHALISSRAIPFHYCWMKPLWIRCNWSKRTCTVSCLVMFSHLLYIPHSLNSPVSTHPAQRLWQTAGAGMIIYFIKWRLPNAGNIDFFFFFLVLRNEIHSVWLLWSQFLLPEWSIATKQITWQDTYSLLSAISRNTLRLSTWTNFASLWWIL